MLSFGAQATLERSYTARRTWPDAYLDLWGGFYLRHPEIREHGVLFETFLLAPIEILHEIRLPDDAYLFADRAIRDLLGLAPANLLAMWRSIELDCERVRLQCEALSDYCSNGQLIERLRHHQNKRARHRRRDIDGRLV